MKAKVTIKDVAYPLCKIKEEDMDDVLKDRSRSTVQGIPVYFDDRGRVWPLPGEDIPPVEFY